LQNATVTPAPRFAFCEASRGTSWSVVRKSFFMSDLERRTNPRKLAGSLLSLEEMRLGVPVWNGRVSPLLDVATRLMVVDVIGGEATFTEVHSIGSADRAIAVAEPGVDVLVCGAISRDLEERLLASGVEVIAEIRGDVNEVIRAALEGSLIQPCFLLPGSHSRRRRGRSPNLRSEAAGAS